MKEKNLDLEDSDLNMSDSNLKWCKPGHANVAEVIYKALPEEIKKNLNLEAMIDASNDPDEKIKDTAAHHYPNSYNKAVKWLNDGKINYETENYKRASYCFGIATHYISDSFAAPHNISKESNKDHHNFEIVDDDYTPTINYTSQDLDSLMKKGAEQGKKDWEKWKETKDQSISRSEADNGASAAYSAIKDIIDSTIKSKNRT